VTNRMMLQEVAAPKGFIGGPFGSNLVSKDYVDAGVPVIRGSNMGRNGNIEDPFVYVTEGKLERDLSRSVARPGDLVFTQRGTLGQVALLGADFGDRYVISQSQMGLVVNKKVANARYIYYACTMKEFLAQIDARAIRTGVPHLNLGILKELTIPYAPLAVQVGISAVLGALDDKIAANLSITAHADSLIRAMYRGLRLSGRTLGEVAVNVRDSIGFEEIAAEELYVGLEHFDRRSLWLDRQGDGADVTSSKLRFSAGDVLFGRLRPYFHKVALASMPGVCSTDVLVVRAREKEDIVLVAAAASSDAVVAAAVQASNGTKMPRAKWDDIADCRVPDPGSKDSRAFCRAVEVIARRAFQANEESRQLAATRDELLPLLMSGKITVKDAEKTVEEVV